MAESLGTLFLQAAAGPIHYAGTCIMGRRVPEGLRELAPQSLMAATQRGIAAVSVAAGVSHGDVERHLPMADMNQLLGQIADGQQRALAAWERHAGHVGGLLEGVTDLTQDGRPPDVSMCLQRLSLKVQADKAWSRPLRDLSKATIRYTDLLHYCRELLDAGGPLAQARSKKRVRRVVLIVSLVVLVVAVGVGGTWTYLHFRAARGRVDAALAKAEICAVEDISAGDLKRASGEQQKAVTARRKQCAEKRAREKREAEQKRKAEQEAARQARIEKEREAQCAALAQAVERGELSAEHEAFAGDRAQLLKRIAQGKVTAADLAPPGPKLPCRDFPSGKTLDAAFAEAVVASTGVWLTADDLSDPARAALTKNASKLGNRAKLLFGLNAENRAQRALVSGDDQAVERALRLCDLKRSLQIVRGPYCDALASARGEPE